jgi:hypothetical protein
MSKHLTTREVVEQRGISHRTLMRMIEDGHIDYAEKLPGRTGSFLFDSLEVERAFQQRKLNPPRGGRPKKETAA